MAHRFRLARSAIDAELEAIGRLLYGGYLRIYGGNQPQDGDAPFSQDTLLAELRFDNSGLLLRGAEVRVTVLPELSAKGEGRATWFRCFHSDGQTPVFDGSVGTRDVDLVLDDVNIYVGRQVLVNKFVYSKRSG